MMSDCRHMPDRIKCPDIFRVLWRVIDLQMRAFRVLWKRSTILAFVSALWLVMKWMNSKARRNSLIVNSLPWSDWMRTGCRPSSLKICCRTSGAGLCSSEICVQNVVSHVDTIASYDVVPVFTAKLNLILCRIYDVTPVYTNIVQDDTCRQWHILSPDLDLSCFELMTTIF